MAGLFVKYHALSVLPHAQVAVLHVIYNTAPQQKAIDYNYSVDDGLPTQIAYIRLNNSIDRFLYPFRYLLATYKGYKMLTEKFGQPHIHHVHILTRSGIIAWYKKVTKGIPYIITEHWSRYLPQNSSSYKGSIRKWLTRKIVKNAAMVTTVSTHLGKAMQKHGLHNSYKQISNVVDVSFFKPLENKPATIKPILLHVSCFDEKPKNVKGILNTAKQLEGEGIDFELRLVGNGKDHAMCVEYAKTIGVKNAVFLGIQTGKSLLKEYQNANAFILFSRFENQPVVILEALACGIPVIATRVGGIPDILKDNFGELITPENEDELANAIKKVIRTPQAYDTTSMRQYAVDNFSYEGVGKQFYDIYQNILHA